jgi:hypothetical protein
VSEALAIYENELWSLLAALVRPEITRNAHTLDKWCEQPPKQTRIVSRKPINARNEGVSIRLRKGERDWPCIPGTRLERSTAHGREAQFDVVDNLINECVKTFLLSDLCFQEFLERIPIISSGLAQCETEISLKIADGTRC